MCVYLCYQLDSQTDELKYQISNWSLGDNLIKKAKEESMKIVQKLCITTILPICTVDTCQSDR